MIMTPQPPTRARIFAVAAGLFVIWGLALWLYNSLFFKFGKFFALSPAEIAGTLALFHIAYVLMALPAVAFVRQFGFKLCLLAGLSVFAVAAFVLYLAIIRQSPLDFLAAVAVIGACGAWLDIALNPMAAIAGGRESLLLRMNFAHAFNGIGLFAGYFIGVAVLGRDYMLTPGTTPENTAHPYVLVGLGAMLLAFLIEQIALPDDASKGSARGAHHTLLGDDIRAALADRSFVFAALSLAAYCAVLTILWTASYQYVHTEQRGHLVPILERGWLWFALGRLAGALLMRIIDPMRLLLGSAVACLATIAIAAVIGGPVGWIALVAASLFLAITYPTLFGAGLARHWEQLAVAAGVLVIAAGLSNALSSLVSSYVLDALEWRPRVVVALALPFEAVVLTFALKARR
jgi:FHS family L-fucose permease-like MFS transporter